MCQWFPIPQAVLLMAQGGCPVGKAPKVTQLSVLFIGIKNSGERVVTFVTTINNNNTRGPGAPDGHRYARFIYATNAVGFISDRQPLKNRGFRHGT
jgi:hypothetical protein